MRRRYHFAKPGRCAASVFHKDCYRLCRGRGFQMHYVEAQCSRKPAEGSEFCWQHRADAPPVNALCPVCGGSHGSGDECFAPDEPGSREAG